MSHVSLLITISDITEHMEQAQFRNFEWSKIKEFVEYYPQFFIKRLIAGIYIGRDHLHRDYLSDDTDFSSGLMDDAGIKPSDYVRVLYEKRSSAVQYLRHFIRCAKNSGRNPDSL